MVILSPRKQQNPCFPIRFDIDRRADGVAKNLGDPAIRTTSYYH